MFENFDLAQVILYLFWIFFAGLLLYLRREDRREGYPLESDTVPGRLLPKSLLFFPAPKTFALPNGGGTHAVPTGRADARPIAGQPMARWPGAPLVPNDPAPLRAGIGPGAYAERADVPDITIEGHDRIVPLRVAPTFGPTPGSPDPRGFAVIGLDRAVAGTVRELWIDRSESVLRYLEVELADNAGEGSRSTAGTATSIGQGFEAQPAPVAADHADAAVVPSTPRAEPAGTARRVLVPVTFANIHAGQRRITVKAILARQFAQAPSLANPDQITLLEEDKVQAFYGAGMLYATPKRAEPLL